jgi:phosphopantetheinyl transferase
MFYIGLSYIPLSDLSIKDETRRILSLFEGKPIFENDIQKGAQGRPFFPGWKSDFNISHSGNMAAVSYVKGENLKTGCDIEKIRPRKNMEKIAKEYFSSEETNYLFSEGIADAHKFFEIWTLKECLLKLRGFSVFEMGCIPSFITYNGPNNAAFTFNADSLSFNLYELSYLNEHYILASVIEGVNIVPQIKWFSQVSFSCKKIAEINAALSAAHTVSPKR